MEIIAGTFEELLLGYKLKEDNGKFSLELSFTNHSHVGAVRSVAISRNGILASGSSDESIHLFHLKKRLELGSLLYHKGSLNCLQFFKSSHLFSGSDDGKVGVWQTGSWERQKALTGHKEAVYSFSVHPTGKLGLSVGKDKTLHTWDLVHGRRGFVINLKQAAEVVMWSPDGEMFAVVFDSSLDIYLTETANVVHNLAPGFKICCIAFIMRTVLAVSGAGGVVKFYDVRAGSLLSEMKTDTTRIKSMAVVQGTDLSDVTLVTASSDGFIKVFRITSKDDVVSGVLLAEVQTNFRLICCCVFDESASESPALPLEAPESENVERDEKAIEKKKIQKLRKKEKMEKLKRRQKLQEDQTSKIESTETKKLPKLKKNQKPEKPSNPNLNPNPKRLNLEKYRDESKDIAVKKTSLKLRRRRRRNEEKRSANGDYEEARMKLRKPERKEIKRKRKASLQKERDVVKRNLAVKDGQVTKSKKKSVQKMKTKAKHLSEK